MKVFRLQHKVSGKGPYAAQNSLGFDLNSLCGNMNARNCPEPDNDLLLRLNFNSRFPTCYTIRGSIRDEFLFGFLDEAQLKKWFGSKGIRRLIEEYDFEVVVKNIHRLKVIKGESQCMIDVGAWFESEPIEHWTPDQIAIA